MSCLGAGGADGEGGGGGGGEVEKLAQQLATLEVMILLIHIADAECLKFDYNDEMQVRELNQRQRADFLEGQAKLVQVDLLMMIFMVMSVVVAVIIKTMLPRPSLISWRREMLIWRKSLKSSPSNFHLLSCLS